MVRTIYCTAVETPAMRDPFAPRPRETFHDLVPWADPYIVALIEKLRRTYADEEDSLPLGRAELPPPLDSDRPDEDNWESDRWGAAR